LAPLSLSALLLTLVLLFGLQGEQIYAMPAHTARGVDRLSAADQHLLRIAAPQRTGTAERPVIDDRNFPAGGADPRTRHLGRRAGADNHKIIRLCHLVTFKARIASWHSSRVHRCQFAKSKRPASASPAA
jgi:hypothetical protein